ncbi:PTS system, cellobiose-specific IIA component [Spiroplasma sp. TIUS-1]|uniref:PTS lactose/cellobiose transporter subunit IIA n=1 Tax=Spiroplasma sp. TIUS-1 TaxID=216963 RepID=UPI001398C029|nr:PTS lactose/cellobiose transporter subunit IIA [Spiroplasma sp. TIUS-1]QHX36062.1 PTS system, cellobiose-specific IIA component [Spiroplasma sp. TIUS-1]
MDWEAISFGIITSTASAKSNAFKAIEAAKSKDFNLSNSLIETAKSELSSARKFHMDVVAKEANKEKVEYSVLYIHAEDSLTSAEVIIQLSVQIIDIWKDKK